MLQQPRTDKKNAKSFRTRQCRVPLVQTARYIFRIVVDLNIFPPTLRVRVVVFVRFSAVCNRGTDLSIRLRVFRFRFRQRIAKPRWRARATCNWICTSLRERKIFVVDARLTRRASKDGCMDGGWSKWEKWRGKASGKRKGGRIVVAYVRESVHDELRETQSSVA